MNWDGDIFNALFGGISAIGGFFMKVLWDNTQKNSEKIQQIEVQIAGKYVTREEIASFHEAILLKLDRIQECLSRKADRRFDDI